MNDIFHLNIQPIDLGGLLLAAVLIGSSTLISYLTFKSQFFSKLFEGTPTLLIHKGKLLHKNMSKERLSESELKTLMRKQGVHSFHDVETAVLEADGSLSITKEKDINL